MPMKTEENQLTKQHFASFYQFILKNGDTKNAEKLLDVYEKWNRSSLMIGFSGHFSAGKSSMIDYLLETSILPKSPIPTSANIVMIQSGNGGAQLYLEDGTICTYDEEAYNIDDIKTFAKTKGTIKKIDIHLQNSILPEGSTIIDTPGVDAADDTDGMITESSLHLMDVLFYVMDYNHVQSEVNLEFLKKVQKYGIPVFIIINQIDKHNPDELTFEDFFKKVKQTFDQWEVYPKSIYYSSIKDDNMEVNQASAIKSRLFSLMTDEKPTLYNIERSVRQIRDDHQHYLLASYENDVSNHGLQDIEEIDDFNERIEQVNEKLIQLKNKPKQIEDAFLHELNTTLKNAYLMPAKLRDKAHLFLEAQQNDFKVGLFGSKKKTDVERTKRSNDFLDDLQKNLETSIQWKLRDKWTELLAYYELDDPHMTEQIQTVMVSYDTEMLRDLIKPGAKITGDYVLVYTNDVSEDIKRKFKQKALHLLDLINNKAKEQLNKKLVAYETQYQQLEEANEKQKTLQKLQEYLAEQYRHMDQILEHPDASKSSLEQLDNALDTTYETKWPENVASVATVTDGGQADQKKEQTKPSPETTDLQINTLLSELTKTIDMISGLPSFETLIHDLTQKYERLQHRSYTIALFGAFSAGKSSVANALLGESVLPSSPNPTTAVINRINPINDTYKHGTAIVTIKDESTLIADIQKLINHFTVPAFDYLNELLTWIRQTNLVHSADLEKTSQNYLQAVLDGYDNMRSNMAQQKTVPVGELNDYVTDERKACFIASVDLYYDCPLTRQGITLVDTPGADSVNARHTTVAFDYIKYADAICYVTYYNHAFSRADKDFLVQLGRVKESFQMDKMFFIMNASDLAEDKSELETVRQYIEEYLISYGIRFPKLFPLSSRQTIQEKRDGKPLNNEVLAIEESLNHFIHEDLTSITKQAAVWDMQRTLNEMRHYVDALQWGAKEKEQFQASLKTEVASLKKWTDELHASTYTKKIDQKLEKQLHYVLERFSIRFHDMFKETFNPATITASGKEAQRQLENCLANLLEYSGYDLMQELRAVSLRIESFITELKQDVHRHYVNKVRDMDSAFMLPDADQPVLNTPEYEQAFQQLDAQSFPYELKQFKGTKAFFAKNEKEIMKDALLNRLYAYAKQYIDDYHEVMRETYTNQWYRMISDLQQWIYDHIDSYANRQTAMLTEKPADMQTLKENAHVLTSMLEKYEMAEV
ncbi:dynamin family protein [Lentibacillus halophilus]|uniref:Dynamin family protein n=1 Tax=Lentibacillus halophilus TaxID=295065 RepID=A0ABP3J911_9BACI